MNKSDKMDKNLSKKANKEKSFVKQFLNRFGIAILAVFTAYCICSFIYFSLSLTSLKKEQDELLNQIEEQKKISAHLKSDIEYMKTNNAVEKNAREKLGLVKPGEILISPKQ